jgi:hypothetical protein
MSSAVSRASGPQRWTAAARRRSEFAPITVVLLTVGVLALRFSQLHQSLYGDEVWTYQDVAGRSLPHVLATVHTGAENSPPLFFVLAWLSSKLGDPSVWIRLPSLLLGTATIPLVYLLGSETVGKRAGVIGAAVVAFGPFSVYYGIEARPYATLAFFLTLSTFALVRAVRSGVWSWWLLYGLAATAAAYTHYTSIFVIVVQGAWSLWVCRRRPLQPLLAALLGVVLYLPWISHIRGKQLGVLALFEPLNIHNVLTDLPRPLTGYPYASLGAIPTAVGLAVVVGAAARGTWSVLHRWQDATRSAPGRAAQWRATSGGRHQVFLVVALALATPIGLLVYSVLLSDLWNARGLYASLPAQALLLGALLGAIPGVLGALALAVVLITLAFGTARAISPAYRRPPFRAAAAYLDRVASPTDPIIIYPSIVDAAIPVQFHRSHLVRMSSPNQWRGILPGGQVFVVIDDTTAQGFHVGTPHPNGFRLIDRRHYTGLDWFSVLTYRRRG